MLYARLQVSCPSKGGDKTGLPSNTHTQQVEPDHQHRISSLIQGRLSVLGSCVDQYLFDTVQLRLRGMSTTTTRTTNRVNYLQRLKFTKQA